MRTYHLTLLSLVGAVLLFLAGFVRGGEERSGDPELVLGAAYALGGLGVVCVVAVGVALGLGPTSAAGQPPGSDPQRS